MARYGWRVKKHGKDRKMPFHPLHRSTPFDVEDLETERITTICNDEGAQVIKDQWTKAKTFPIRSRWTEYTFFKMKEKKLSSTATTRRKATSDARTTPMSSTVVAASSEFESADEISNGSFER